MAAENSSNAIDEDTSLDSDSNTSPNANDVTNHDSSKSLTIPSPAVCLVRFAGDAASGAVMGSIFGYGDDQFLFLFISSYYVLCRSLSSFP